MGEWVKEGVMVTHKAFPDLERLGDQVSEEEVPEHRQ